VKFADAAAYSGKGGYRLLPMRFRRLPWDSERVLVSSLSGDWIIVTRGIFEKLVRGELQQDDPALMDFEARHLAVADVDRSSLAPLLSQMRTRKSYLEGGPALHIFVISLRCHHSCSYCQVSRQPIAAPMFDMSPYSVTHAVDRLFEWPSRTLTVEFQGGEPLLNFDQVRRLTESVVRRNLSEKRSIRFVLASTLHDISDSQLDFMKEHDFQLSTSLDGPDWLHNANRPRAERDSHRRTLLGIERGRRALGEDAVSALTTLTARSLGYPKEIIDEYRRLGFHSIFLRPLSPYGFARKTHSRTGYGIGEFLVFYRQAMAYLLELNRAGYPMEEVYASLLLSQLMTPYGHGYVDMRSPTGAGFGAIVYDYDGFVYPSDEARMLAAMGNRRFALGRVEDPVQTWLRSPAMMEIAGSGVAEALPTCADCAYVQICGADPIDHYARQGDVIGHRPSSDFCARHMGIFDLLVEMWDRGSESDRKILDRWALRASTGDCPREMVGAAA